MLELFVTACLAADPSVCAERLVPRDAPVACADAAPARAAAWDIAHDDLSVTGWECRRPVDVAQVQEVAPGVWVHTGRHEVTSPENAGDLANTGFVIGRDAVAVIDAGGSRQVGEALYAALRQVTDLPVRHLILTHMHPDHTLGASVFRDAGAEVIGHANLGAALAARADTYTRNMVRIMGAQVHLGSQVVLPGRGVTGRTELDLGDRVLVLEPHPTAHTDNDLTVFDTATDTWWLSDLVFDGHTPALDGSITGWLAVLAQAQDRAVARIVPGHGPASLPWPEGGTPTRAYLAALAEATRAAIARGDSLRDAVDTVGADLRDGWLLFDEFNPRNATAAFTELEWE